MQGKKWFTGILAGAGALLVWLAILAPLLLSFVVFVQVHELHIDCLMPAELFPAVLLGGLLLVWAASRACARRSFIGWSFGAAIALLASSQALAVVTGLASGAAGPAGWRWLLVRSALFIYVLAVALLGIGGLLLLRDVFKPAHSPGSGCNDCASI